MSKKTKLYFSRQTDENTCRYHAINNALGKQALNYERFLKYCDEYDKKYNCQGSREFFLVNEEHNLISYILSELGYKSISKSQVDAETYQRILTQNDVVGIIVFSDVHVWSYRKNRNKWYEFDSLSPKEEIKSVKRFDMNLGCIFIVAK